MVRRSLRLSLIGCLAIGCLALAGGAMSWAPFGVAHAGSRLHSHLSMFLVQARVKLCHAAVVDDYSRGIGLFNIHQNASLTMPSAAEGSQYALPKQIGDQPLLRASPTGADGFSVGRTFPIAKDWHRASALGMWYYGHRTGTRVGVTLLGARAPDPGPTGWSLAWSDEFDGTAGSPPNPAIWGHDIGGNGWGNHELEYYTNSTSNASLDGAGNLVITARKTGPGEQFTCYYGDCTHTSARLLTKDRLEVTHGRIEARIKIPRGSGLWPAFWALGSNIDTVGWPQSGEIDIMENVGRQPLRLYGTIHGPGYSGANGVGGTFDAARPLSDDFHVYAVEWQADRIVWTIDGKPYFSATPSQVSPNQWVYNRPFFLLLNVAVGGDFGGPVASDTVFPQSMTVDYVRVYSASDTSARFTSSFVDNFSGWKFVSLPFSRFARSATQPAGAPDGRLTPKTIWGYSIDVPAGVQTPVLLGPVQLQKVAKSGRCGS